MTLLADVVAASAAVASTASRSAKVARLAELLGTVAPEERVAVVGFLVGQPRQGRVGVGWASVAAAAAEPAAAASITVLELDAAFEHLPTVAGSGSVAARQQFLRDLFARATAAEAAFIGQLLTGELRQGALAGVMAEAIARAAGVPAAAVRRAAMLHGDLGAVAAVALDGGVDALAQVRLTVLRPVLPMLAATAATAGEAVRELGRASVEWKLDGARIQAHRAGTEVRLFTRNLNDVTDRLPAVRRVVRSLPVEAVVLDGEVMGVGDDDAPDAFQDTMSRFGTHGASEELQVSFFDCLHLDGRDLLDAPLDVRRRELERVAGAFAVPAIMTADPEEADRFSAATVDAGHEGVMVKAAASAYESGRRGKSWRKVKPVLTLDLVVLGAEWGHGRRRGRLSNLHLGARGEGPTFVMVGKTFKGLTDAMLEWQTAELLARETRTHGIVVEVRPELVVEVAVDGVLRSPRYPGGVSLRFARVRRYRQDKTAADTDTIETVRSLLRGST